MKDTLPQSQSDLYDIKRDMGFQSRYSQMDPDYIPIIKRVAKLEEQFEAILKHLGVKVIKERNVVVEQDYAND